MDRAYSILTVKAVQEDAREIRGVATTPSPDRYGDIVEPMGVQFRNPMPLLWQHRSDQPIGTVTFDKPSKDGVGFVAKLAKVDGPTGLVARIDEAWASVKAGLVRAVSIGFRPVESAHIKDGGTHFLKSEVLELSLVTIPANADCTITTIKSIDTAARAASGVPKGGVDRPVNARVRAPLPIIKGVKPPEKPMKTIAEQIAAFEATRASKSAEMLSIMNKSADEGVTLDAEQADAYDALDAEVKSIDAHIVRLRAAERQIAAAARPVDGSNAAAGSESRGGGAPRVEVKGANLPKGTAFTRYAMALMVSKGNLLQAEQIAKNWRDTPDVETVIKAAVAAGTTTDVAWAKPLVEYQTMASEFAELLRPATIIGRIPNLRRVPFNVKVPRQTAGSTAGWVGEAKPKPVSALAFDQITLGFRKLAGIVVLSEELVRFSNPSAEAVVRQDLIDSIVSTMDKDFVDPANAGVADVKPASITNGVTAIAASGTSADALRSDVKAVMTNFTAANLGLGGSVWIMPETTAISLSLMMNALGQPENPNIDGTTGGTFFGLPVILSQNVPAGTIILAKASEIMLADDGQVMIDVSREASLQMDSAPASPPDATTVLVSLWQHNMVGLRAERYINWTKRRAGAVQMITGAAYV